jgi:hypothetical protein
VGYLDTYDRAQSASNNLDNLDIEYLNTTAGAINESGQVLDSNLGFANIVLTSLTDEPIASSSKLLLTTVARTANTGQTWSTAWQLKGFPQQNTPVINDWYSPTTVTAQNIGQPPILVEPVNALIKITVDSVILTQGLHIYKLNQYGQRLPDPVNFWVQGNQIFIDLRNEQKKTIWHVIEKEREPYFIKTPVF